MQYKKIEINKFKFSRVVIINGFLKIFQKDKKK